MSSINVADFQLFVNENVKLIVDSNNNLETLEKSKLDYENIKSNVNTNDSDILTLCYQFEYVLKLGFERIEKRKIEALDKSCPFSLPF